MSPAKVAANGLDAWSEMTVSRAIGNELRRAREEREWSRGQLVARLPSGIGDRTLLSYEHGTRRLTAVRLIEICRVLGVDSATLHRQALQRACLQLESLALRVDLNDLLKDQNDKFRPMRQWALNSLNEYPDGVVEVEPDVVRNLALFVGCRYSELANHLARFLPDDEKVYGESSGAQAT